MFLVFQNSGEKLTKMMKSCRMEVMKNSLDISQNFSSGKILLFFFLKDSYERRKELQCPTAVSDWYSFTGGCHISIVFIYFPDDKDKVLYDSIWMTEIYSS